MLNVKLRHNALIIGMSFKKEEIFSTRQQLRKAAIMVSAFFILLNKRYSLFITTNVFDLLQPSSGFYNLAILINFKFTYTHKKQQQQKTMYIFKKQAVLLTNRLNFKSKLVRD